MSAISFGSFVMDRASISFMRAFWPLRSVVMNPESVSVPGAGAPPNRHLVVITTGTLALTAS